jgi:flagellar hook-basal body complex protein FliE
MPISAIPSFSATGAVFSPADVAPASGPQAAGAAGFENSLTSMLDNAAGAVQKAESTGQAAATGDLRNVHDYMIASAEASTMLEMTVAVKNEAIRAFQSVMNTPV